MNSYDQRRRDILEVVPPSDCNFRSALGSATYDELTTALHRRAFVGHKTAYAALRAEIHRRHAESGDKARLPDLATYVANAKAREAAIAAEHARYAAAPAHRQAILRAHGYVPPTATPSSAAPAPSSPLPAPCSPMSKPAKHALTLVADPAFAVAKSELKTLQATALAQIAAVGQLESQAAIAAILTGLTLHRVKASLKHGEFRPWIESANVHRGGHFGKTTANHYMRLATVFLETAKVTKPALLALPGDQTVLDLGDQHPAKDLLAKARKFCGGLSLTELLIKHGIKGVGLKTELTEGEGAKTEAELIAEARARAWEESYHAVQSLRSYFAEPEKAQLLTDPAQIETLRAEALEITRLADERLAALRAAAKPAA